MEYKNERPAQSQNGQTDGINSGINVRIDKVIENMYVFGNDVDAVAIADRVSEAMIKSCRQLQDCNNNRNQ